MTRSSRLRRWGVGLLAAAAVSLMLGAGFVISATDPAPGAAVTAEALGSAGSAPLPAAPPLPPESVPQAAPGADPTGRHADPVPPSEGPVTLHIPSIDLSAGPLSGLGLNPDDTVEVPTDFARAGWFELGPSPGEIGSAVILGHVDSLRGPAVFFRLRELRPGDRVDVELADGSTARFAVTAVETYPKEQFPARRVYASTGSRDLQLVTCGGEFDRGTGHYLANVVVYTSMVGTVAAG